MRPGQNRLGQQVLGEPFRAGGRSSADVLCTCCDSGRLVLGVFVCRCPRPGSSGWPWRFSTAERLACIGRRSTDPGDDWARNSDRTPRVSTFEGQCERNRLAIAERIKDSVDGPTGSVYSRRVKSHRRSVNSAVRRFLEMLLRANGGSDDHPA